MPFTSPKPVHKNSSLHEQHSFLSDQFSFHTARSSVSDKSSSSSFVSTANTTSGSIARTPSIRLNLSYSSKAHSLLAVHNDASDSSIEDFSLYDYVPKSSQKRSLETIFTKFIPITEPLQFEVPRIQHNDVAPTEWEECQNALLLNRACSDVRNTKSDTEMITKQSKAQMKKKSKLKRFFHKSRKLFALKTRSITANEITPAFYITADVELPKLTDSRLSEAVNMDYVQTSNKIAPRYSAALYVEKSPDDNLVLCHSMTELAVSAMSNFFCPHSDVQCIWIAKLQDKIREEINKPFVHAKFTRLVYLGRFDALLVLSRDAGALMRHKNLCFLHSLAASLDISPHKLLILQNDNL